MQTLLIVGAGFCGTLAAVHLLRRPPPGPVRIILLNRSGLMARGVAYGTRLEHHVLNVPAGRMGAFPDREDDFLRYAEQYDARNTGASFLPRMLYGQYLESLLSDAALAVGGGVSFRSMVGEAIRIRPLADGHLAAVDLAHGESIIVDRVVLALGNYSPTHPKVDEPSREFFTSPRYVQDAWKPEALRTVPLNRPALLIGTGLTMLDVLLDLHARGMQAPIYAISRRGLLPLAHRDSSTPHGYDALGFKDLIPEPDMKPSTRAYVRTVRRKVREAAAAGIDWRDVVGALRAATPALWQALPPNERRRFLRHVRPFWDVHRHRCAPELATSFQQISDSGQLRVLTGRLVAFSESVSGVEVSYRARAGQNIGTVSVASVINCTGPENDTRNLREPLLVDLRERGLVTPDELGLGFQTADNYALIGRDGQPSKVLFYAGPFLRATHWEATAVPELRVHVAALAESLRRSLVDQDEIRPGTILLSS